MQTFIIFQVVCKLLQTVICFAPNKFTNSLIHIQTGPFVIRKINTKPVKKQTFRHVVSNLTHCFNHAVTGQSHLSIILKPSKLSLVHLSKTVSQLRAKDTTSVFKLSSRHLINTCYSSSGTSKSTRSNLVAKHVNSGRRTKVFCKPSVQRANNLFTNNFVVSFIPGTNLLWGSGLLKSFQTISKVLKSSPFKLNFIQLSKVNRNTLKLVLFRKIK